MSVLYTKLCCSLLWNQNFKLFWQQSGSVPAVSDGGGGAVIGRVDGVKGEMGGDQEDQLDGEGEVEGEWSMEGDRTLSDIIEDPKSGKKHKISLN